MLRLLVRGLSYSGSAKALCVEPSTVKYHVINMLQKIGLENKLQPAIVASEAKPVVELAEKEGTADGCQACIGRVTVKTVPCPSAGSAVTVPPSEQGNLPYKRKPKAYAAHLPASGFTGKRAGTHLSDTPQECRSLCLQHAAQRCFFSCRIVICTEPPGVLYLMPFSTKLKSRR